MSIEDKKRYVIAVKHHEARHVKPGWQEQMALMPGVSLVGASPRRVQVDATPEAIRKLADELGEDFLVEELVERKPSS
jgi:hypothetical protein